MTSGDITQGPGGGGSTVVAVPKLADSFVYAENLYGDFDATTASAGLLFKPSGALFFVSSGTNGTRSDAAIDQWVDRFGETVQAAVDATDFEVQASLASGSGPITGAALNTWHNITADVAFTLSSSPSATSVLQVTVRKKSTGQTATAQYTLTIANIQNPGGA
jgi:hypothetical protein